jgi:hypothetical protein
MAAGEGVIVRTLMLDSNEPLAGVRVEWEAHCDTRGEGQTDSNGEYRIPGLTRSCNGLMLRVSRPGMVSLKAFWNTKDLDDSTDALVLPPAIFFMEKAVRISGRLLDETGKPIGGGTVCGGVHKVYPARNRSSIFLENPPAQTMTVSGISTAPRQAARPSAWMRTTSSIFRTLISTCAAIGH